MNYKNFYSGELKTASDKDYLVEEDGEAIKVSVIINGLNYFSKARWQGADEDIEEVIEILDNSIFRADESLSNTPEVLDSATENVYSIRITPMKNLRAKQYQ